MIDSTQRLVRHRRQITICAGPAWIATVSATSQVEVSAELELLMAQFGFEVLTDRFHDRPFDRDDRDSAVSLVAVCRTRHSKQQRRNDGTGDNCSHRTQHDSCVLPIPRRC